MDFSASASKSPYSIVISLRVCGALARVKVCFNFGACRLGARAAPIFGCCAFLMRRSFPPVASRFSGFIELFMSGNKPRLNPLAFGASCLFKARWAHFWQSKFKVAGPNSMPGMTCPNARIRGHSCAPRWKLINNPAGTISACFFPQFPTRIKYLFHFAAAGRRYKASKTPTWKVIARAAPEAKLDIRCVWIGREMLAESGRMHADKNIKKRARGLRLRKGTREAHKLQIDIFPRWVFFFASLIFFKRSARQRWYELFSFHFDLSGFKAESV